MNSTLIITTAPTLLAGLPELARIAACQTAANENGMGLYVERDLFGKVQGIELDDLIDPGTIEYGTVPVVKRAWDYFPNRDVVVTADGVHWL